ncbi:uncharacterized protein LOC141685748 [Apium graveolens]|uniref:uncharacterized protein LOC141685748 n=1 Tax=Apium graveolens TaxID=4045 RepID=UPI003D7A33EE
MEFAKEIIVPTLNSNISRRQRELLKKFPGAIGALDGTLVHAIIPTDLQARYKGRGRCDCYQNVLAVCDFYMIFTFVWAGWEGVAHDSRILTEVALDPYSGFPVPPSNNDGEGDKEDLEGPINDTQWGSQATQYMNDLRDQIAQKL